MFAISYFVGSKYGGWITGTVTYANERYAKADADRQDAELKDAGVSQFLSRVVRV